MREGMQAGPVQRVTKRQLGLPQGGKLRWCGGQREFCRDGRLHRDAFFFRTIQSERRAVLPPAPEGSGYPHRA